MEIKVLVEIPQGSSIKYELDKESGKLFVDRFLYTAMFYPFNYGYILNTLADDGDPLDALVLGQSSVLPGSIIKSKPIGVLLMEDEAGKDEKIIAVPLEKIDPLFGKYNDLQEIPEILKNKIKHFFENYKTLEPGKWVKITDWEGKDKAEEIIKKFSK